MALRPWAERCAEGATRPLKMEVAPSDCLIGGNSPGVVYGVIEDTPGNTPLNRATGQIQKMPGSVSKTGQLENPNEWINSMNLSPLGAYPYTPTGVDRG